MKIPVIELTKSSVTASGTAEEVICLVGFPTLEPAQTQL